MPFRPPPVLLATCGVLVQLRGGHWNFFAHLGIRSPIVGFARLAAGPPISVSRSDTLLISLPCSVHLRHFAYEVSKARLRDASATVATGAAVLAELEIGVDDELLADSAEDQPKSGVQFVAALLVADAGNASQRIADQSSAAAAENSTSTHTRSDQP